MTLSEHEDLQAAIGQLPKTGRGRRYPRALRERVLAYASSSGQTLWQVGQSLGVPGGTLSRWRKSTRKKLRRGDDGEARCGTVDADVYDARWSSADWIGRGAGSRADSAAVVLMLALPRSVQVWAYPAPTDLRKGYNGLYALVQHGLERDPRSGELFVFVNRNRTLCKVLMWDGTGL